MAVDLHTAQIQGFFDGPVDHLFALPLLASHVGRRIDRSKVAVVSPDAGRVRVAERWSETLGGAPLAFIHKRRDPDRPNEATANRVVGDVDGRVCILQDDMIDTGGTIAKAADALFDAGAADVIVAATHGIFSPPGHRPAQELPGLRGRRHRHAADHRRAALRQADGAVDRPAARARHPRGLRRRLGHQPVRRQRLTRRPVAGTRGLGRLARPRRLPGRCPGEGATRSARAVLRDRRGPRVVRRRRVDRLP